jgi:hypothetical protein
MATASLADHRHQSTREERALELYRTHGRDIERISADVYRVPSELLRRTYTVDYRDETCTCPDFEYGHGRACKHILAVGISRAKRRGDTLRSLAALEEDLAHELMDDEERQELRDQVLRLRRKLGA